MPSGNLPLNVVSTIAENDFCCGCGICTAICPNRAMKMQETALGCLQPILTGSCSDLCRLCLQVCPFSNETHTDEGRLGQELFSASKKNRYTSSMGWVGETFYGGLSDAAERMMAPSGGLTTAVLAKFKRLCFRNLS